MRGVHDENDPQYAISKACLDILENSTDNKGRKIKVHKLPVPKIPVTVTENDIKGYIFEDGEDTREVGERLAASYVNFYFCNDAVILPQFGGENAESDRVAAEILERVCKEKKNYSDLCKRYYCRRRQYSLHYTTNSVCR